MIKYVYVVMRDVEYEGSSLVAVYRNIEAAEARARTEDAQALASDISHSVLAVPIEDATP